MGRCGRWATKVSNFFTDEEGAEASPVVGKVANSIVLMSYGREEDPERDFFVSRTPNWKLRLLNVIVGLIQLATGVIIAGITKKDSRYPWYTDFAKSWEESSPDFYVPDAREVADMPIGYYSAVFLWLSAFNHFLTALPGGWQLYKYWLQRNQNHFRWLEYSVSASIMHVMGAQLSGATEIHLLFAIFVLGATTMIFGSMHERANWKYYGYSSKERPRNWQPLISGFVPHLGGWLIILCYFFQAVSRGDPPGFVWAIIFIIFFLDNTFAVMLWLQWFEWGIFKKNYVLGEIGFIILSLTSKQLLAWINYGGSQRA